LKAQRDLEKAQQQGESMTANPSLTSSSKSSSSGSDDEQSDLREEIKSKWRKFRGKSHSPNVSPPPASAPPAISTPPLTAVITATSAIGTPAEGEKPKISLRLLALLVYTVGVKCYGIGRQAAVTYEPEHMFSLSENTINRLMKASGVLRELIEHTQTHLVRIYPKGIRVNSTNYEPHRYWAAGAQVVAINWQTFGMYLIVLSSIFESHLFRCCSDLGYTINQAMFQRNGKAGYVLKPFALRSAGDKLLNKRTRHFFDVTVRSSLFSFSLSLKSYFEDYFWTAAPSSTGQLRSRSYTTFYHRPVCRGCTPYP
jgi:phosphatidylinositol phospholipase C delta